jgi:hypothetical protein
MELSESSSTDPSTNRAGGTERQLRILLIDADPAYLVPNRQRLEQEGYEVLTADLVAFGRSPDRDAKRLAVRHQGNQSRRS